MRRSRRVSRFLLLFPLVLFLASAARADRVVPLKGFTGHGISPAEGAPTLRYFPGVIGGGEVKPLIPGSGRTYADFLSKKPPIQETTIRVAVFRIEYENDSAGDVTTGDGRFLVGEDDGTWIVDYPPHDSTYFHTHMEVLRRYYHAQSYGRLNIQWEIFPKSENAGEYRLHDTADYLPEGNPEDWSVDDRIDGLIRLCTDAIVLVDTLDSSVDFSAFDGFVIIHPGPDLQTDINGDTPGDTPSFFLAFGDEDQVYVDKDGGDSLLVPGVTMVPEYTAQDGFAFGLNGVIAHEFGHQLGLPDLYNTEQSWPAIGVWGLMDSGGMIAIDAGGIYLGSIIPASLSAWSKLYLGWASPEIVTASGPLSVACATDLGAAEETPRYAVIPVNDQEYFLLENRYGLAPGGEFAARQDTVNGVILGPVNADNLDEFTYDYDYILPGWGLLVWHINNRNLTPERLLYLNDINVDYNDRAVELEEADGIKDLGNPYSPYWDGSPFDPFFQGNADRFTSETYPNSDLSDGAKSMVGLYDIGPPDRSIDLLVDVGFPMEGWPLALTEDSLEVKPLGLVVTGGERDQLVALWSLEDSAGVRYGVTAAARSGEGDRTVQSAQLPAPPVGLPLAGAGTYAIVGDRLFRIDPSLAPPWVDLGGIGSNRVAAGPLLFDTDGDGAEEILFAAAGSLHVLEVVGDTVVPKRDPIETGARPGSNLASFGSAGGDRELLLLDGRSGDLIRVAFRPSGVEAEAIAAVGIDSAALLTGNLDGEGGEEIVMVSPEGRVWTFDESGSVRNGWPVSVEGELTGEPFLSDRNEDGLLEVALPVEGALVLLEKNGIRQSGTPLRIPPYLDRGYFLSGNGVSLAGGEGDGEGLLLSDRGGRIWKWDGREEVASGWPRSTGRENAFLWAEKAFGDGEMRLFAFAGDGFVYAFPLEGGDDGTVLWRGAGAGPSRTYAAAPSLLEPPSPHAGPAKIESAYCYPNPVFGNTVRVRYSLSSETDVSIQVHDGAGDRVIERIAGPGEFGENEVALDTGGMASGVYHVKIDAGSEVRFVKVAVVR